MPCLADIRHCLDGVIPATLCTCAADGLPNTAYISQVFYVDDTHVALSFQFFNKTRQNILANPRAVVLLIDPDTVAQWRLHITYLRTEASGPVFEAMKAQLAGIASHAGLEHVFTLRGSDIYRVEQIEQVAGVPLPRPPTAPRPSDVLRRCSERLARCTALDDAIECVLDVLTGRMAAEHAMVLLHDEAGQRLYTVASRGYDRSGAGSELRIGEGVIGVAARERTPVRIGHMVGATLYNQALRSSVGSDGEPLLEVPYPGLKQPRSQLAAPMLSAGTLLGVLFVESAEERRFNHEDEDTLAVLANHLAAAMQALRVQPEPVETPPAESLPAAPAAPVPRPLQVRRFRSNGSVFVDGQYLIKGVAGAILWKLVRDHQSSGRTDFSNRELRLDSSIGLPDLNDNLEARLILLQRRLEDQACGLRIEKTGRGRFRLLAPPELGLHEAD
jgi:adenylate cyclase